MTYPLNDRQYAAVRRLSPEKRYEHLVKRAADTGELWALEADGGWVLGNDVSGRELLPVRPHPKYAEACAVDAWRDATPVRIDVHDWLEKWTQALTDADRLVGIFPTDEPAGAAIDPKHFAADLTAELALIE